MFARRDDQDRIKMQLTPRYVPVQYLLNQLGYTSQHAIVNGYEFSWSSSYIGCDTRNML